jgi:hypothetical protein
MINGGSSRIISFVFKKNKKTIPIKVKAAIAIKKYQK